ncbi:MAG: TolC family protein [Synergistaceae bacterium]|nr:TolC family protein [Synergistaceae bacterium]
MQTQRRRKWINLFLAAALCALTFLYLGQPSWGAGERVLTLAECLRLAEAHHPALAGADAAAAAERGRLSQTVAGDRVEVSGTASASRSGGPNGDSASYSAGASASVKVFDANRSKYATDAQRKSLSAAEANREQTLSQIRANVKSSYMNLLLSSAVRGQRRESVDAFRRHLEQARGFYEAGSKPRFDVTKAEVDLGSAELALLEAESDIDIAQASLLNAIGVEPFGKEPFDVAPETLDISPPGIAGLEEAAESLALERRADYRAAGLRALAGKSTLKAEARASSPSVSLRGGWSGGGDDLFALDSSWNTGLSMSIPIVDGGAAAARLEIASAQIRSLEASKESLRQDILLEVRKAALGVKNARERIRVTELTVVQAEENYTLAEGRYETGVGSALEITDALLALTDARLSAYRARHDLQIALISLEKAIGPGDPNS